jgi:GNAT superfamily N-acetyltransferase
MRSDIDTLIDIDDDASMLFDSMGMYLDALSEREVVKAARNRWSRCLEAGTVLVAVEPSGREIGFAALGHRDCEPYLDQLSVRRWSMGYGVGTALLSAITKTAAEMGGHFLWLTTYNHLSWNRPYYERRGFVAVSADTCGQDLQRELEFERSLLPEPEQRIPMRLRLRDPQAIRTRTPGPNM